MTVVFNNTSIEIAVNEPSQVGEARRAAARLAGALGFNERDTGRAALIVTEAATNLEKHAEDGVIILTPLTASHELHVVAIDCGPGMADVALSFRDGVSSTGTSGGGLGAIARQADQCDVYSVPGQGTTLWASVKAQGEDAAAAGPLRLGAVNLPKPGQTVSGDSWGVLASGKRVVVLVADGLGHGNDAAEASNAAVQVLRQNPDAGVGELLRKCHADLSHTRGAAVAIAEIDLGGGEIHFTGLGNVRACVTSGKSVKNLPSYNGTAGVRMGSPKEFTSSWAAGSLLLMASDGLSSQLGLDNFPGLITRSPGLIAGRLHKAYRRGSDDALVLVATDRVELE